MCIVCEHVGCRGGEHTFDETCILGKKSPPSQFYYYTKWLCRDYDENGDAICHSTWKSLESPKEFIKGLTGDVIEYRKFETLEEMEKFAATVGLR